jgi:hypothetical protein
MPQKPCAKSPDSKVAPKRARQIRGDVSQREQPRDTFQVVVHCADETEQERLYEEFRSRGMQVRLLTM